jgi:hypothetical protein
MRCPSVFAREDWLTIPFIGHSKSTTDRIIDIATLTSTLLYRIDSLNKLSSPARAAETLSIKEEALQMKAQLDNIWMETRPMSQSPARVGDSPNGLRGFDSHSSKSPSSTPPTDTTSTTATPTVLKTETPKSNAAHANDQRTMTFYSTTRLILLSILHTLGDTPPSYEEQITAHCASILTAAAATGEGCIGYANLRLVLPLRVVGMMGTARQRERAREIVEEWARVRKGLEGVCASAVSEMGEGGVVVD